MSQTIDLDANFSTPQSMQFGIFSSDEIRRLSVCEITSDKTLDDDGDVVPNGLYDLHMGPQRMHGRGCATCGGDVESCPGHFGHVNLAIPIFHPCLIKTIAQVLRCICLRCGKLLLDPNNPENEGKFRELSRIQVAEERLQMLVLYSREVRDCKMPSHEEKDVFAGMAAQIKAEDVTAGAAAAHAYVPTGCGAVRKNVHIRRDEGRPYIEASYNDTVEVISPDAAYDIFSQVSDRDARLMGLHPKYCHPKFFIITVLPIMPPITRTSVQTDTIRGAPDDFTVMLSTIIATNNYVKDLQRPGSVVQGSLDDQKKLLYWQVHNLFNNGNSNFTTTDNSGRPLKGISQKFKGKFGLIRLNLMGKRVDFSARTVITGDPTISIEEVGVPLSVAKTMTFPEVVTEQNREDLLTRCQNGDKHPGARTIIVNAMEKYVLPNDAIDLSAKVVPGTIVERHMVDGDFVLFNRQPTLHKVSIMGHRVKILPYSTFRLNLSVTTPYNADFDGDEMNMHFPQSQEGRAEIKNLMLVPNNIVVAQKNAPVIGVVQDSLLASYLMTRRDVFLNRSQFMNLLMWVSRWKGALPEPAIIFPEQLWTGKQVFSMIMPDPVNMEGWHPSHDDSSSDINPPDDTHVLMRNGQLLMGMMSSAHLGQGKRGLVHILWLDHGPNSARRFLNGVQRITNAWLLINGFTVGVQDIIADATTKGKIKEAIEKSLLETNKYFYDACQGNIEMSPGQTPLDAFEAKVSQNLGEATKSTGRLVQESLSSMNNIRSMVVAGSKGSQINLAQIIACLGQQSLLGKRIPFKFLTNRTLPHFSAFDYGAVARGYIQNSYLLGLNPIEFFFHAVGGREGLIDTAVKTADTGYSYRRLVKSLEDITVEYDGSARRSTGEMLETSFGDDGIDAQFMEMQHLDFLKFDNKRHEEQFRFSRETLMAALQKPSERAPTSIEAEWLDKTIAEDTLSSAHFEEIMDAEYRALLKVREELREVVDFAENMIPMPVNVKRILLNATTRHNIHFFDKCTFSPLDCLAQLNNLVQKVRRISAFWSPREEEPEAPQGAGAAHPTDVAVKEEPRTAEPSDEFEIAPDDVGLDIAMDDFEEPDDLDDFGIAEDPEDLEDGGEKFDAEGFDEDFPEPRSLPDGLAFSQAPAAESAAPKKEVATDKEGEFCAEARDITSHLLCSYLRHMLSPKQICFFYRFSDVAFKEICEEILTKYKKARVSAGEPVGVIAAESIAQPMTQLTLNTFHLAGVASMNVTLGLPRLKEIIGVSRNMKTPSASVILSADPTLDDLPNLSDDERERRRPLREERAKNLQALLEYTTVKDLVSRKQVIFDPDDAATNVEEDKPMLQSYEDFGDLESSISSHFSPWIIRLEFHRGRLQDKGITLKQISNRVLDEFGCRTPDDDEEMRAEEGGSRNPLFLRIYHSTELASTLVMRIRPFANPMFLDARDVDVLAPSETHDIPVFVQHTDITREYKQEKAGSLPLLSLMKNIFEIPVSGIHGINRAYIRENKRFFAINPESGGVEKCSQWIVDTEGINKESLVEIMCQPEVAQYLTTCNDINVIFETFGIEAARNAILLELKKVMSAATYINSRHLLLLIDHMTFYGNLTSVDRHGMGRRVGVPLLKASNEQPLANLFNAAAYGVNDPLNGMTGALITSKIAPTGTGKVVLQMSPEAFFAKEEGADEFEEQDTQSMIGTPTPGFQQTPGTTPFTNLFSSNDINLSPVREDIATGMTPGYTPCTGAGIVSAFQTPLNTPPLMTATPSAILSMGTTGALSGMTPSYANPITQQTSQSESLSPGFLPNQEAAGGDFGSYSTEFATASSLMTNDDAQNDFIDGYKYGDDDAFEDKDDFFNN
eukprot:gnl/Chilomastix_cuspidata/418.p1 GENE.gnl/Chilomastix_cuspidata/418~~gnl/Chilomastix_cuspidata/418.p1  ORF type:complete len:1851 (-),score=817.99 gnl/Chilomastix_cuspidata/418:54-5606(-)